jgi:hypothetical protein
MEISHQPCQFRHPLSPAIKQKSRKLTRVHLDRRVCLQPVSTIALIKYSQETVMPDPFSAELRTAINIKTALDRIWQLQQIGYCPTKVQAFRQQFRMDDDVASDGLEGRFRARDLANQVCKRGM